MRVMLFTDTLGDVNGVSRFIRNAAAEALATGRALEVVTSTNFEIPGMRNLRRVMPLVATRMPRYEQLELAVPPVGRLMSLAREFDPDVVHVSTPGPVGLVGRLAAGRLRRPLVGVYHTDFPAYVERLFGDDSLAYFTSGYMKWFYRGFAAILTRSEDYAGALERLGIPRQRLGALRPGISLGEFGGHMRDEGVMARLGMSGPSVRVLYVGRVSTEKNIGLLERVWPAARRRLGIAGVDAELVVVGDGPAKSTLERSLRGEGARFLGFRHGAELSAIYAGCDLFVFPSTTDTLGQVVMEAQASGLPVLVSDQGGPREVVMDGETGLVLSAGDERAWEDAVVALATDAARRRGMGRRAAEFMSGYSMRACFEHFWSVHERVAASVSV